MKKVIACLLVIVMGCSACLMGLAEVVDFSGFTDEALTALYNYVKEEMERRGLSGRQSYELPEGKYIIGQDILPGRYRLICTKTAGESLGNAYSSLGSFFGGLSDDGTDYGSLFGSLGGMMSEVIGTTVEVIGDYGTVIKEYELKEGQEIQVTLEVNTAIRVADGECRLVPVE